MPFDATDYQVDPLTITDPRERLRYVSDFLKKLPREQFNMNEAGRWRDGEMGWCRSPACIGGWARALFRFHAAYSELEAVGERLFALPWDDAHALFYPGSTEGAYAATPSEAARVIDHLLATGEVDWSVFRG